VYRKNSGKPDEGSRSLGVDGDGPTVEEGRGGETARKWERSQTAIKMGRLC